MTESNPIQDDLRFVAGVVDRRDKSPLIFTAAYYIWAVYVLVGYCLLDVDVRWANWFFLLAWFPAGMATGIAKRQWIRRHGENDAAMTRKRKLHFMVGGLVATAAVIGLAICVPTFRGQMVGQVSVEMFGLVYFLAGIHIDRQFLWLGPVLIVGGMVVGFVPHYGWTALGVVIAAGLCAAGVLGSRPRLAVE